MPKRKSVIVQPVVSLQNDSIVPFFGAASIFHALFCLERAGSALSAHVLEVVCRWTARRSAQTVEGRMGANARVTTGAAHEESECGVWSVECHSLGSHIAQNHSSTCFVMQLCDCW